MEEAQNNLDSQGANTTTPTENTSSNHTGTTTKSPKKRDVIERLHKLFPKRRLPNGTISGVFMDRSSFLSSHQFTIEPHEYGFVCAEPGQGPEGGGGYRVLTEKVKVSKQKTSTNIFCAIYTHQGGKRQTNSILQTWGQRCDGYMAVSTESDPLAGTVNLPHPGYMGIYTTIWQKVRAMLAFLYEHHLVKYDFFHICGDDTYLIVQ